MEMRNTDRSNDEGFNRKTTKRKADNNITNIVKIRKGDDIKSRKRKAGNKLLNTPKKRKTNDNLTNLPKKIQTHSSSRDVAKKLIAEDSLRYRPMKKAEKKKIVGRFLFKKIYIMVFAMPV